MVGLLPQNLIMPGLYITEQATKAAKELIQIIKNLGPKNPLMIGDSQLHAIDMLATLFHNKKMQQPNPKVVPREVLTVATTRMTSKVPSPMVPMAVAPPRVIEPRVPVIPQDDNIEEIRHMEMVKSEKMQ